MGQYRKWRFGMNPGKQSAHVKGHCLRAQPAVCYRNYQHNRMLIVLGCIALEHYLPKGICLLWLWRLQWWGSVQYNWKSPDCMSSRCVIIAFMQLSGCSKVALKQRYSRVRRKLQGPVRLFGRRLIGNFLTSPDVKTRPYSSISLCWTWGCRCSAGSHSSSTIRGGHRGRGCADFCGFCPDALLIR